MIHRASWYHRHGDLFDIKECIASQDHLAEIREGGAMADNRMQPGRGSGKVEFLGIGRRGIAFIRIGRSADDHQKRLVNCARHNHFGLDYSPYTRARALRRALAPRAMMKPEFIRLSDCSGNRGGKTASAGCGALIFKRLLDETNRPECGHA